MDIAKIECLLTWVSKMEGIKCQRIDDLIEKKIFEKLFVKFGNLNQFTNHFGYDINKIVKTNRIFMKPSSKKESLKLLLIIIYVALNNENREYIMGSMLKLASHHQNMMGILLKSLFDIMERKNYAEILKVLILDAPCPKITNTPNKDLRRNVLDGNLTRCSIASSGRRGISREANSIDDTSTVYDSPRTLKNQMSLLETKLHEMKSEEDGFHKTIFELEDKIEELEESLANSRREIKKKEEELLKIPELRNYIFELQCCLKEVEDNYAKLKEEHVKFPALMDEKNGLEDKCYDLQSQNEEMLMELEARRKAAMNRKSVYVQTVPDTCVKFDVEVMTEEPINSVPLSDYQRVADNLWNLQTQTSALEECVDNALEIYYDKCKHLEASISHLQSKMSDILTESLEKSELLTILNGQLVEEQAKNSVELVKNDRFREEVEELMAQLSKYQEQEIEFAALHHNVNEMSIEREAWRAIQMNRQSVCTQTASDSVKVDAEVMTDQPDESIIPSSIPLSHFQAVTNDLLSLKALNATVEGRIENSLEIYYYKVKNFEVSISHLQSKLAGILTESLQKGEFMTVLKGKLEEEHAKNDMESEKNERFRQEVKELTTQLGKYQEQEKELAALQLKLSDFSAEIDVLRRVGMEANPAVGIQTSPIRKPMNCSVFTSPMPQKAPATTVPLSEYDEMKGELARVQMKMASYEREQEQLKVAEKEFRDMIEILRYEKRTAVVRADNLEQEVSRLDSELLRVNTVKSELTLDNERFRNQILDLQLRCLKRESKKPAQAALDEPEEVCNSFHKGIMQDIRPVKLRHERKNKHGLDEALSNFDHGLHSKSAMRFTINNTPRNFKARKEIPAEKSISKNLTASSEFYNVADAKNHEMRFKRSREEKIYGRPSPSDTEVLGNRSDNSLSCLESIKSRKRQSPSVLTYTPHKKVSRISCSPLALSPTLPRKSIACPQLRYTHFPTDEEDCFEADRNVQEWKSIRHTFASSPTFIERADVSNPKVGAGKVDIKTGIDLNVDRLMELNRRNTLLKPHLRTTYPVETQGLKEPSVLLATLAQTQNKAKGQKASASKNFRNRAIQYLTPSKFLPSIRKTLSRRQGGVVELNQKNLAKNLQETYSKKRM